MRIETTEHCTLYLGDCLDVLPTLVNVDAVVTDPPYGISLRNHCEGMNSEKIASAKRTSRRVSIAGDDSHDVALFVIDWCGSTNTCCVVFGSAFNPYPRKWRNILVWNKGLGVGGGGDTRTCFKRNHELIYINNNGPLYGGRDGSVIDFTVGSSGYKHHPAQKPVGLMERIISKITTPGSLIADPCMGSGTTGVACVMTRRKFIGIEKDPEHFEVALTRIREAEAAVASNPDTAVVKC